MLIRGVEPEYFLQVAKEYGEDMEEKLVDMGTDSIEFAHLSLKEISALSKYCRINKIDFRLDPSTETEPFFNEDELSDREKIGKVGKYGVDILEKDYNMPLSGRVLRHSTINNNIINSFNTMKQNKTRSVNNESKMSRVRKNYNRKFRNYDEEEFAPEVNDEEFDEEENEGIDVIGEGEGDITANRCHSRFAHKAQKFSKKGRLGRLAFNDVLDDEEFREEEVVDEINDEIALDEEFDEDVELIGDEILDEEEFDEIETFSRKPSRKSYGHRFFDEEEEESNEDEVEEDEVVADDIEEEEEENDAENEVAEEEEGEKDAESFRRFSRYSRKPMRKATRKAYSEAGRIFAKSFSENSFEAIRRASIKRCIK